MEALILGQVAVASFGGAASFCCQRAGRARAIAIASLSAVTAGALLNAFLWPRQASGGTALIELTTAIVGLAAAALTPLLRARAATFGRIQLLCGFSLMFFATAHPLALAFLWSLQAFLAFSELRQDEQGMGTARLFAVYHAPSCALFLAGILLFRLQMNDLASWCILLAVLIREGVMPFQTWFSILVEKAPMGIAVMFVEPQVGLYALHELVPSEAFSTLISFILPAFAATAVLGAGLSLAQTEARRALGFLMLSQSSLIAFGLEQSSHVAQAGSLLTWQVIGVATGSFALTLAALEARKDHLGLMTPSGNFAQTPKMATAFLILGFASVGLPGTLGFIAEDLLVQGSVGDFPLTGFLLIIATALHSIVVMRLFFYLFCGRRTHAHEPDLVRRESFVLSFVVGLLLMFGLAPQLILGLITAG